MTTEVEIKHMHEDLETLKNGMAVVIHILSEEGELTEEAKKLLEEARRTPKNEYISHEELKKRLLNEL